MPASVLIVDDDPRIRVALSEALASDQLVVRTAESAEEGLRTATREPTDVVLADVRMPGGTGLELLKRLRHDAPDTDVILMTAYEDLPTVAAAMRDGAVEFLVKPLDLFDLRRVLERVLGDRHSRGGRHRHAAVEAGGPSLIGRDPSMIAVFKRVGQAAAASSTVLIRGESGTGKELIARSIHALSARAERPFVAVNCAAVPENLLETELFGHVRGAFTGATADRAGRFAHAAGGTIFLDEIGDTSPDVQAKLLRVLQDGEYYAVGTDRAQKHTARVITATQDLEDLVDRDEFRRDLYYRLRVLEIVVPPLRNRRGDIPVLAEHLLQRKSRELGRAAPVLAAETAAALAAHDWPGNVRELENCIERALVVSTGNVIRPEHLQLEAGSMAIGEVPLGTLEAAERVHLLRVLQANGGNKSRASATLGISRPRLDRLIAKYGLEEHAPGRGRAADSEEG